VTAVGPLRPRRLRLQLVAADVPRAEALLSLAGADTLALLDAADDPVLEPEPSTAPLWPNVTLEALFARDVDLEPLRELMTSQFPGCAATVDTLEPAEWEPGLRRSVHARAIGNRLWLAPADESVAPPGRVAVRLHMGLAFGTGEHPTTALCLEWLERHVADGVTLLDFGCGSGVLALAALGLGARYAYAVDNDPQAVMATARNAELNGAAGRLFVGAPESLPSMTVDVLAANILAAPLIELAPTLAGYVVAGGRLVLSGILERQAALVMAAYVPYFVELEQVALDGWVSLAGRRNSS
jgi:ribosomal protein L11 methyltransferase